MIAIYKPNWEETLMHDYKRAVARLGVMNQICEALKPFNGKEVTKRLATTVEKRLGENYAVFYDSKSYGWHELSVWARTGLDADYVPYKDRISANLGYKSSNCHPVGAYNHSWFMSQHMGYLNHAKKLESLVDNIELLRKQAQQVQALEMMVARLEDTIGEQAGRYLMHR
jgi:hypothetical protein